MNEIYIKLQEIYNRIASLEYKLLWEDLSEEQCNAAQDEIERLKMEYLEKATSAITRPA